MVPPILGRYQGQQPAMAQFGNLQQRHVPHRPQPLATPSSASHLGLGNVDGNLNLFSHAATSNSHVYGNGFGGIPGGTGLASHAAQLGFAHGAALQRQERHDSVSSGSVDWKSMVKGRIRDVWRSNLAQEMAVIRTLMEKYPYVSMVCRRVESSPFRR